MHDQYWFDANTGWIAGRNALLYSTNGGTNYINLYSNIPPTGNGQNELLSIIFVNQQTGWIGGSNLEHQNLYITTNSGANWTFQPNPAANYAYPQINDVNFMTQDSGWAVNGTPFAGAIMFTTNRGTNWEVENGSSYWFNTIAIYQRSKAWVGASSGTVWYAILDIPTRINTRNVQIPDKYSLSQNYPNPFNPVTGIDYSIPRQSLVKLIIYDVLGRNVITLVDEMKLPGNYNVTFDASAYPSGVYFYRLTAGTFTDVKKMVLLK